METKKLEPKQNTELEFIENATSIDLFLEVLISQAKRFKPKEWDHKKETNETNKKDVLQTS